MTNSGPASPPSPGPASGNPNGVSIQLLKDWLKVLEEAVFEMRRDQYVFKEVFAIIDQRFPNRGSYLFTWMYDNYVSKVAMGVRRMQDGRAGTISIKTFLRRLKGDPSVISRKYYRSQFPPDFPQGNIPASIKAIVRKQLIDGDYDRLVGSGLQQPTAQGLDAEIAQLHNLGDKIVDYATKRIAHHDEIPPAAVPTLDDVDVFLDYAEKLVKKYIVLIHAVSQGFGTYFQYDWRAPLREAWLPTPVLPAIPAPAPPRRFRWLRRKVLQLWSAVIRIVSAIRSGARPNP